MNMTPIDWPPVLDLLKSLVTAMVFHPEDLKIDHKALSASLEVRIQANAADTSRLIGKGRQNHKALSTLFAVICRAKGFRFYLARIVEPAVGEAGEGFVFLPDPAWPRERIKDLLCDVARAIFPSTHDPLVLLADSIDDDRTTLEVYVSPKESREVIELVRPELDRIFGGIGSVQGRKLAVDVIPQRSDPAIAPQRLGESKEIPEVQPKSASGRWAKEV